ncbi:MAG: radical SAM-associated putative lipoprotein [Muribaculaceae bacterium]|nr:radical SAM-associated putative lipoprotein [Muribaculaceae bacterium]
MKLIKRRTSSFMTSICSVLLSLLGFSCSSSTEDYPVMYGIMPSGSFGIKGTVTDEKGNNIDNAEIRVTDPDYQSYISSLKTKTNSEGMYDISAHGLVSSVKVVCIPQQNNLEPDSIVVDVHYKDKDEYNVWNNRHVEKTVDFKLKEKIGTQK